MYAKDFCPIDPDCKCPCCRPGGWGVTRSLIYHLACKETGTIPCSRRSLHFSGRAFSYDPQCAVSTQPNESSTSSHQRRSISTICQRFLPYTLPRRFISIPSMGSGRIKHSGHRSSRNTIGGCKWLLNSRCSS